MFYVSFSGFLPYTLAQAQVAHSTANGPTGPPPRHLHQSQPPPRTRHRLEGEYSVEGKSDGKEYSGAVTISKERDDYKLNWKVANSTAIS